jgi:type IV pilus assembly protein PilP
MKNYKLLILAISVVGLVSCKSDTSDLDEYFKVAKMTPAKQIEPLPEINSPEIFIYDAEELRDPFSNDLELFGDNALEVVEGLEGPGPDLNRRKELLENFPLDSLFMVGTYLQESDYWGLIEDPEGVIHRVSLTEHLGQNYGEIIAINEDQIDVSEWVADGLGGWTKREASIALREE